MTIVKLDSKANLERCFPIVKELRPHLDFESFLDIYEQSHKMNSYQLVGIESNGEILAIMGFRILYDLVRGKHLYIDDLVTTQKSRSLGLGKQLLEFAETQAKEQNCRTLRLCTGLDNTEAMRFYEKCGWKKRSVAFTKKLLT